LQASDLHNVAAASLAIFAPMRQVARDMLQAKLDLEVQQRPGTAVARCGQEALVFDVYPRTGSPETIVGEGGMPVRTFQESGGGGCRRPDDRHLGVPEAWDCTDDVRVLYAPLVAERPSGGQ